MKRFPVHSNPPKPPSSIFDRERIVHFLPADADAFKKLDPLSNIKIHLIAEAKGVPIVIDEGDLRAIEVILNSRKRRSWTIIGDLQRVASNKTIPVIARDVSQNCIRLFAELLDSDQNIMDILNRNLPLTIDQP